MDVAIVCTGLLGLLLFGLGLAVSLSRGATNTVIGASSDPTDRLYKLVRAHGNAAEYAPMLAILMIMIAGRTQTQWLLWVFAGATLSRYLHAAGMIFGERLDKPHALRFVGALGTYVFGLILAITALFR